MQIYQLAECHVTCTNTHAMVWKHPFLNCSHWNWSWAIYRMAVCVLNVCNCECVREKLTDSGLRSMILSEKWRWFARPKKCISKNYIEHCCQSIWQTFTKANGNGEKKTEKWFRPASTYTFIWSFVRWECGSCVLVRVYQMSGKWNMLKWLDVVLSACDAIVFDWLHKKN